MQNTAEMLDINSNLTADTTPLTKPGQNQNSSVDIGFPELDAVESIPLLGISNGIMEDWLYDLYMGE